MSSSQQKLQPTDVTLKCNFHDEAQPLLGEGSKLENVKEITEKNDVVKQQLNPTNKQDDDQRLSAKVEYAKTTESIQKSVTGVQSSTEDEKDILLPDKEKDKVKKKKAHESRKLTAADRASSMSFRSFSISAKLKRHDNQCKWHNRKRKRNAHRSKLRKYEERKKEEEEFLEVLEEYKNKKFSLMCVCKRKRLSWLNNLWGIAANTIRYTRRFIWCCCCPPLLGSCLNKVAFWPPPREYYFFVNNGAQNVLDDNKQKPVVQQIVRRANKECMKRLDWRFGFEHECATEVSGIECFVTKTERKNHIACVFVRKSKPRYTLLFSHPNGSDLSDYLVGLPNLHDAARFFNCNVCSYDYSGYGISEGCANEKNLYADINAVYKHLLEHFSIPEASIILWGYSIGTVATVHLATQATKLAGLILLAPVASIIRTICWRKYCWNRSESCGQLADCCCDRFNLIKKIGEVEMPTLIAHGMQDTMVSVEHGKALHRLCPGAVAPLWIPDAGHNNIEKSAILWRRMREFIYREARSPSSLKKCESLMRPMKKHALKTSLLHGDKKELRKKPESESLLISKID